ncbi:MAG: hypothetical protein ACE5D1_09685, partial [Fidelibacterota bacterium]
EYLKLLKELEKIGEVTPEMLQGLKELDQSTMFGFLNADLNNAVKKTVAKGLLGGLSEEAMVELLLSGDGGSLTTPQLETLINTALNTYSRTVTAAMAESLPKRTKYLYIGPVDDKTRDICLAMIDAGALTRAEIDAQFPGAFVDGGGFNCRHRWAQQTALTKSEKPKAKKVIQKIKEKRDFNPKTLLQ